MDTANLVELAGSLYKEIAGKDFTGKVSFKKNIFPGVKRARNHGDKITVYLSFRDSKEDCLNSLLHEMGHTFRRFKHEAYLWLDSYRKVHKGSKRVLEVASSLDEALAFSFTEAALEQSQDLGFDDSQKGLAVSSLSKFYSEMKRISSPGYCFSEKKPTGLM
ncbi:MAG TPA: hypothetical protein ENN46_02485 [Candidatus Woesearchaeota archaeon]|nr:hypothetical protein [Candidatus Woesearchaeota archaeon]